MFNKESQVKNFIIEWYSVNARILPWRKKNKDKYLNPNFVFVSEYMLQQTTVNTVKNKFGQPDLITSHNALAHIDDLKKVFENVFLLKYSKVLMFFNNKKIKNNKNKNLYII